MSSMKDSSFGRFLSRRDKDSPRKAAEGHKRRHLSGDGILNHFRTDEKKKIEKEDMKKVEYFFHKPPGPGSNKHRFKRLNRDSKLKRISLPLTIIKFTMR